MTKREPVDIQGEYQIRLFRDAFDNTAYAVTIEGSNTIQICGLKDEDTGEDVYFESEAYHASLWCTEHGIIERVIPSNFFLEM